MTILIGGKVYGLANSTTSNSERDPQPQRKDIVIAAGKIISLIDPSNTIPFIDSIRRSQMNILPVSVQDQIIIPGLIDVHVHAIGGGGEQGQFHQ